MKNSILLFFVVSMLLSSCVFGQESIHIRCGSLSGTVVDGRSGLGIPLAVVTLSKLDKTDTSDMAGKFTIDTVPVGIVDVGVAASDYESRIVTNVLVQSGRNRPIIIEITKAQVHELPGMRVTGSHVLVKKAEQTTSVIQVGQDEIRNSPGAIEDVNRVIQSQPSAISAQDEENNSFYVRGGSDRENVFFLDGIELNNLSHWGTEYESGGAITMLNPTFVKTMDYYAGGFPARYPPRVSSVVDIAFRDS